jgi:hypothetical protein
MIRGGKDPLTIRFSDRQEALSWLRSNNLVMQYIVVDAEYGCMLRIDDTYKPVKK